MGKKHNQGTTACCSPIWRFLLPESRWTNDYFRQETVVESMLCDFQSETMGTSADSTICMEPIKALSPPTLGLQHLRKH